MTLLAVLLLSAVPAPAFDVPIRQISLRLDDQEILEVMPGRCQLRAPGQTEPVRVTARLTGLRAEDLGSLLMVSLGQGLGATSWAPACRPHPPRRPRAPAPSRSGRLVLASAHEVDRNRE